MQRIGLDRVDDLVRAETPHDERPQPERETADGRNDHDAHGVDAAIRRLSSGRSCGAFQYGRLVMDQDATRRDLLLASVMAAALPLGLSLGSPVASASPINPAETIIKLPADLAWKPNPNNPPRSSDSCALAGAPTEPGLYYTLVRWWPGYMSAPHSYTSDRFCMVMSGTWGCNNGNDFHPASS